MRRKYLQGLTAAVALAAGLFLIMNKTDQAPTGIIDGINHDLIGNDVGVFCKDAGETCYEFSSSAYKINDNLSSTAIRVAQNVNDMKLEYESDTLNDLIKDPAGALAIAESEEGVDDEGAAAMLLAMLGTGTFGSYDFPMSPEGVINSFNIVRYDESRSSSDNLYAVTASNPIAAGSELAESIFQAINEDNNVIILVISSSESEQGYLPGVTRSSL